MVGASTNAATAALAQVIPSRVGMAAPGMIIPPLIMAKLEKTATFVKNPWLKAPVTVSDMLRYMDVLSPIRFITYHTVFFAP